MSLFTVASGNKVSYEAAVTSLYLHDGTVTKVFLVTVSLNPVHCRHTEVE